MPTWHTGREQPRCIYRGDQLVGLALTIDDAARIVRAMNEREQVPPHIAVRQLFPPEGRQ